MLNVAGKDTLFIGDDGQRFRPQIDLTHQLYLGENNDNLLKKRQNAEILKAKGLGDGHRMYEIRGVSHFDLQLRTPLFPEGWPAVSRGQPVEEECRSAQAADQRNPAPGE